MPFRKTIVGFGLSNVGICLIGQKYAKDISANVP